MGLLKLLTAVKALAVERAARVKRLNFMVFFIWILSVDKVVRIGFAIVVCFSSHASLDFPFVVARVTFIFLQRALSYFD
jgi:hypothetical protein